MTAESTHDVATLHRLNDVAITREVLGAGWAVFTGCEGDSPDFCAFFARKQAALDFMEAGRTHPNEDLRLCDPAVCPAVVIPTTDGDAVLVVADDYDHAKGAAVLIERFDLGEIDADTLREEGSR